MQLVLLDWVIIVGYFVVTLAIGAYSARRAGKNMAEFFVSGRSLPWWIAGTSMVATTFAADTPLAVTGLIVKNGLAGNWFWWAFAIGGMFTVFVYARLWRRAEVMTDVELIKLRYSGKAANGLRRESNSANSKPANPNRLIKNPLRNHSHNHCTNGRSDQATHRQNSFAKNQITDRRQGQIDNS